MVMLQSTPTSVELSRIKRELTGIAGVLGTHDLHVWQLVDGMIISSVHLRCDRSADFMAIATQAKKVFHRHGIHSSTIQPELVDVLPATVRCGTEWVE